jgi:hypothetical protein
MTMLLLKTQSEFTQVTMSELVIGSDNIDGSFMQLLDNITIPHAPTGIDIDANITLANKNIKVIYLLSGFL